MLDTTNPAARKWMKEIIKHHMIGDTGVSGWMADFGESLPFEGKLFSGEDAASYHNKYPEAWAKLNEEAVAEARAEGLSRLKIKQQITNGLTKGEVGLSSEQDSSSSSSSSSAAAAAASTSSMSATDTDREVIYFMRSASLTSPRHTSLFWLGE